MSSLLLDLPTAEEARARFWELEAEIRRRRAASQPARDARDEAVNKAKAEVNRIDAEMSKPIRDIEDADGVTMYELKMAKSQMAKLAGGNVGVEPGAE